MILLFFIGFLLLSPFESQTQKIEYNCPSPWIKEDNHCFFITNGQRSFKQAKDYCRDGSLLYIKNEKDNSTILGFISSLKPYYFNVKPYLWLDAKLDVNSGKWKWSKSNTTINHAVQVQKKQFNCLCLKMLDFSLTTCDCDQKQHFMCRKKMQKATNQTQFTVITENELNIEDDDIDPPIDPAKKVPIVSRLLQTIDTTKSVLDALLTTTTTTTTTDMPQALPLINTLETDTSLQVNSVEVENSEDMEKDLMSLAKYLLSADQNNEINKVTAGNLEDDEQEMVLSELKLLKGGDGDDDDVISIAQSPSSKLVNQTLDGSSFNNEPIVANLTAASTFTSIKPTNEIVLVKMNLLKETRIYRSQCEHGFGYYAVTDTQCKQYKKCSYLNKFYAVITLYKCVDNHLFDFKELKCSLNVNNCNNHGFVPIV